MGMDTWGSHTCTCNAPFRGDGTTCCADGLDGCNSCTKKKCLQVKNRKKGKKCAWREIDGTKQCVLRASCSGIKWRTQCNKKKKKRACSWKKESQPLSKPSNRMRNLKPLEGGTCVPK